MCVYQVDPTAVAAPIAAAPPARTAVAAVTVHLDPACGVALCCEVATLVGPAATEVSTAPFCVSCHILVMLSTLC